MVCSSATAALCSGMYSFGVTLVIWSCWICVGADCLAYCLGCWRPWWGGGGVVFRGDRRVRRFVLCQACVMFPLVLLSPLFWGCVLLCMRSPGVAVARCQMICFILMYIGHACSCINETDLILMPKFMRVTMPTMNDASDCGLVHFFKESSSI